MSSSRLEIMWMRRTSVKNNDLNPVWKEAFTFPVENTDSSLLKVELWDDDTWRRDDKMGDAEIDLKPLFEKQAKHKKVLSPCKDNCLYKDSSIFQYENGRKTQEVWLKLRNVESGSLNLQMEWTLPST
ncbi:protein C2-DOMAIN ABA-RELATED 6 isoform X2 [Cryptomeria japonica]|uniref:protein C2-DOMAIN ABA-RELATED 6 isoform X2 n=1 Tax=Cryptomeria japonica TaxID=3369 RepID=UPI0027DA5412|nr:protein C2-DOMAIN ABA-RELATED 6 isoform X2 [Cryptomeria japonica]